MSFNGRRKSIKKQPKMNNRTNKYNLDETKNVNKGESLIKCIYDIKELNYIQIINDGNKDYTNENIKNKIKIWNNNKKEELTYEKKFNKLGLNTIWFIIEKKLDNLSYIFKDVKSLKQIEFINTNTEGVTGMHGMFSGCNNLEYIDLSSFDTSNVTDISFMFNDCQRLKEIKGMEKFNISKVITMRAIFQNCKEIEYINLSSIDTSNIIDMSFMFNECNNLKEIKGIE